MRRSRQGMRKDDDVGKPDDPKMTGQSWIDGGEEEIRVKSGKKKRNRDEGDGKMDFKEGSNSKKGIKLENQNDEAGEESDNFSAIQGDQTRDRRVDFKYSKMVHVEGIPYDSIEDDIRSFFNHCGTITEVFCLNFIETNKFKGVAIITFKTEEAAERAIDLDESQMGESFLEIEGLDLYEECLVSCIKLNQIIISRCGDAIQAARNKRRKIAEEFTKTIESMISEGFLVKDSSLWRFAVSMLPFESYHIFTLICGHNGRLAWLKWEFKRKTGFKDIP